MKRLLLLFLLLALKASATTYYVDWTNGNDANNGTSKVTAWKHAPGMTGATGLASSTTLNAGDSVILRGCVTWPNASLMWTIKYGGVLGNPVYYGVDKTWWDNTVTGCASAWNRPILNGNGIVTASGPNVFMTISKSYVTIDNIEFTKGYWLNTPVYGHDAYINPQMTYMTIQNCYFHGWINQGVAGLTTTNDTGYGIVSDSHSPSLNVGMIIQNNVVDGSDTAEVLADPTCAGNCYGSLNAFWYGPIMRNNVCNNVSNCYIGGAQEFSGNLVENIRVTSSLNALCSGVPCPTHENGFENNSDPCATGLLFFNNVLIRAIAVNVWIAPTNGACIPTYAFNNVTFNTDNANVWDLAHSLNTSTKTGTYFGFNNTLECGRDSAPPSAQCENWHIDAGGQPAVITNEHYITSHATPLGCTTNCTTSNTLAQTKAVANAANYSIAQTYGFSPTSGGSPTVGTGVNHSAYCTSINAILASAGAACLRDTSYAVNYNTSNHTVTGPARTTIARPGGAWSIGAYEYSASPTAFLTVSPSPLACGSVAVGSTFNCGTVTLQNTGAATLTSLSSSATWLSNTTDYSIQSNTCGTSLAASATCTFAVQFRPQSVASLPATLTFTSSATNSPTVGNVTGTGTSAPAPNVALTPSFTVVQHTKFDNVCLSSTTCAFTIPAVGTPAAGTSEALAFEAQIYNTTATPVTFVSATGCGGTWQTVTGGGFSKTYSSPTLSATVLSLVNLAPTAACTSVSVMVSGTVTGWIAEEAELNSVSPISIDTGAATFSLSCQPCLGPNLTLTGSSDFILEMMDPITIYAVSSVAGTVAFTDLFTNTSVGVTGVNNTSNGTPLSWTLSGTGPMLTSALAVSSIPALNFGNQAVGVQSGAQVATVTNIGNATLNLQTPYYTITGANAADFVVSSATCSNGGTVAASATCTVSVKVTTSIVGAETATLTILGDDTGSMALTATGTSAGSVAIPTLTPGGGTYASSQTVTLVTATSGGSIVYTTDGSTPTVTASTCTVTHGTLTASGNSISVITSETLTAIGCKAGLTASSIATAAYLIITPVLPISFSPVGATYSGPQFVSITTATSGATICYTTDGSNPTTDSNGNCTHGITYGGAPTVVNSNLTIKAIGTKAGSSDSAIYSSSYVITIPQVNPAIFSPDTGNYATPQTVTITSSTPSATLCYTRNGVPPVTNGQGACLYGGTLANGGSIIVSATSVIEVIGSEVGYSDSPMVLGIYIIGGSPAVGAPTKVPLL